jgi:hypothetical protein
VRWPAALWRRNAIGAAVVCMALTVIGVVQLWPQWSHYRETVVPEHVVSAGDGATVDGQTWKIASVRHLAGSASAISAPPAGTSLTVITVARSGPVREEGCTGVLTDGRHRWSSEIVAAAPLADGATTTCALPGPLQLSFAIPNDARPQALDITALDGRIRLRLQL